MSLELSYGVASVPARSRHAASNEMERKARIERLVRDYYAFVWRSLRRLGVSLADVDDASQEVFVRAARNVDAIVDEHGYLFRACLYAAGHARRRAVRRREVDDSLLTAQADLGATPEQSLEMAEARERLQAILQAMPDELAAVFVLAELELHTMVEIAAMLQLPKGTVVSRLRRARAFFLERARASQRESHDGNDEGGGP